MTTTTKEKIAVMQAFEDGKPIECMNYGLGVWEPCDDPSWDWLETDYRVAVTKPSWDWSHVSDEINYLVRQPEGLRGGVGVGASHRPEIVQDSVWYVPGPDSKIVGAAFLSSYDPGTCDWRDSLVVRPGYKEASHDCT